MIRFLVQLVVLPVRLLAFVVRLVTAPLRLLSFVRRPRRFVARWLAKRLAGRGGLARRVLT